MKKSKILVFVALAAMIICCFSGCGKKSKDEYRVIKVESITGSASVERSSKKETVDAFEGMQLVSEDVISVGDSSELLLLMDSKKHMCASSNTKFEIKATGSDKKGSIKVNLLDGEALFTIDEKLNDDSTFEVTTPNATLSVRGTTFTVTYDGGKNVTTVEVEEGVVYTEYNNGNDSIEIGGGQGYAIENDELIPIDEYNTSNVVGGDFDVPVANDAASIKAMYMEIVQNMTSYVAGVPQLSETYITYDYMYFDYNSDGINEVVLYLLYNDAEGVYMRDVVFLYYNADAERIQILGINHGEENDTHFYCEYNGKLARYSWRTNPYESYLYVVSITADNSIQYVLETAYDEVLINYEDYGMHPLPLYLHTGPDYTDIGPFLD